MSRVLFFSSVVAAYVAGLTLTAPAQTKPQGQRPLIIDMHMHAFSVSVDAGDVGVPPPVALCFPLMPHVPPFDPKQTWKEVWADLMKNPPCPDPIWSPATDEALIEQTVAILERRNVIGVLSGPPERLRQWREAAPGRFIPALRFQIGGDPRRTAPISVETFRQLVEKGEVAVLAEVLNQYAGVGPDDPRFEPYLSAAEELDIPVGIHMGEGGPPGAAYLGSKYRARLTSPYLLEDVLIRHPKLRVFVMHYGSPLVDEMISMLSAFPGLYVDIGGMQWWYPRAYFKGEVTFTEEGGVSAEEAANYGLGLGRQSRFAYVFHRTTAFNLAEPSPSLIYLPI